MALQSKNRRTFLHNLGNLAAGGAIGAVVPAEARISQSAAGASTGGDDRAYWVEVLTRIARPVLTNLAHNRLRERMPIEAAPGALADRRRFTYLEAISRLLAGLAPWLELTQLSGAEESLRREYAELSRQSISHAVDPRATDFMNFTEGAQPVVDAAFLANAVIRAPNELWRKLDGGTRRNLAARLKSTRIIKPHFNNWLLFSAMIEAALALMGEEWDRMRVDYAIRQHEQWYAGDGVYSDGPEFHWDYYNSFVIHPMLIDVLGTVAPHARDWDKFTEPVMKRARRYAEIQERLISPEGTFPPIGRSLAYRFAVFHLLAQIALMKRLPESISPAQVRSALTAVIRRMIEAPGTFDADGWLTIGFYGHQPSIGERYISTGSLYGCVLGMLPLGLPPGDEFWSAPPAAWTARKIWSGQDVAADHAI